MAIVISGFPCFYWELGWFQDAVENILSLSMLFYVHIAIVCVHGMMTMLNK